MTRSTKMAVVTPAMRGVEGSFPSVFGLKGIVIEP